MVVGATFVYDSTLYKFILKWPPKSFTILCVCIQQNSSMQRSTTIGVCLFLNGIECVETLRPSNKDGLFQGHLP